MCASFGHLPNLGLSVGSFANFGSCSYTAFSKPRLVLSFGLFQTSAQAPPVPLPIYGSWYSLSAFYEPQLVLPVGWLFPNLGSCSLGLFLNIAWCSLYAYYKKAPPVPFPILGSRFSLLVISETRLVLPFFKPLLFLLMDPVQTLPLVLALSPHQ